MYRGMSREETKPHIFAVADEAFRNLVDEGKNQSILITGESGAGKTENTKKVIQYLAAVAAPDGPRRRSGNKALSNLSQQILQANPILEAFGNAQTVRNNNSSRFGKFIRIQFTRSGQIAGALIDWYLLEKSRVVGQNAGERNYHIFYQLLRGADRRIKNDLLLGDAEVEDFEYTAHCNDAIAGVSDAEEWNALLNAFHVMEFSQDDQIAILRTIAAVLHLGNVKVAKASASSDHAVLSEDAVEQISKACQLLGISRDLFVKALLHPRVKAGREIVTKDQTPAQVRQNIDALSKGIYERGFRDLVNRINRRLNISSMANEDTFFVGVLDIAGFEIFERNTFEQLCINYTNEKLQQFFNHHMFVLEQEEYAKEQIDWTFIDFGQDLQPTIDLIEVSNPIGIFSCLDEDCVMPKASDKTFTEKLHSLWDRKTAKYKSSRLSQGFMLTHYAATVEYSTEGWLEKNKDPLNDNATGLLAKSDNEHIGRLFSDCLDPDEETGNTRSRVKKGLFRTVAQRHKEQLSALMAQLHSTHPHFVRCILPNHKKKPKHWDAGLVLDQLRCNGVLEGIRIARTGFPNRIPFAEFRSRYEVLCKDMPRGYLEGQVAASLILEQLELDPAVYRVGITKVFFRAGVLADLEDRRDDLIREIMQRFQSVARGYVARRAANKVLYRTEAAKVIQQNFQVYMQLQANPWWRLFVRMRPLLGVTRQNAEVKKREEQIKQIQLQMKEEANVRAQLEEHRRRAEAETRDVQKVLESERALALDKEELFKRSREREANLTEQLSGALADQEKLEAQVDEIVLLRKKAEERATGLQKELEKAAGLMANLEREKQTMTTKASTHSTELQTLRDAKTQGFQDNQRLQQQLQAIKTELESRERQIGKLEAKRQSEERLASELRSVKNHLNLKECRIRDLEAKIDDSQKAGEQIRSLNMQINIKDRNVSDLEDKLASTEAELNELRENGIRADEAEEDQMRRDLNSLRSELGVKERKIRELEARSFESEDSMGMKLAAKEQELQASRAQARELLEERRTTRQQVTDQQATKLRQREEEVSVLREENESLARDCRRLQAAQARGQDATAMLAERDSELGSLRAEVELLRADCDSHRTRGDDYHNRLSRAEEAVMRATRELESLKGPHPPSSSSHSNMRQRLAELNPAVSNRQGAMGHSPAGSADENTNTSALAAASKSPPPSSHGGGSVARGLGWLHAHRRGNAAPGSAGSANSTTTLTDAGKARPLPDPTAAAQQAAGVERKESMTKGFL